MVQHADIDHSAVILAGQSYGSNANSVSSLSAAGASGSVSRADHVHVGVRSLTHTSNTWNGPITLVAQGAIGITKFSDSSIAINAVAGSGGGSGSSDLSGKELDYAQRTTDASITATSAGAADTVITGNAVVYDGTAVLVEFYSPYVSPSNAAAARNITIGIFESTTEIARIGYKESPAATFSYDPMYAAYRFTPTAASHTYLIKAWVNAGTGAIGAGVGGAAFAPAFMRITRIT